MKKLFFLIVLLFLCLYTFDITGVNAQEHTIFMQPTIHMRQGRRAFSTFPTGLSPAQIQSAYNLPSAGGAGTIAIVNAYGDPNIAKDLSTFSSHYNILSCTIHNGCFEVHPMSSRIQTNTGWALEESLDVEWAHAIAPKAHILLIEARSNSLGDLLNAVNYARNRSDVKAVSMSWGSNEFSTETAYDTYLTSTHGVQFFASSGDSGNGVIWPSASPNVIGIGGTTLTMSNNTLLSETAWSGSGGGVSAYETEPDFQRSYNVPFTNGFRAVPDVSYDADPQTGVSIYDSLGYAGQYGWFQIGGTSVGAPQWAAISTLSNNTLSANAIYANPALLRDILTGSNGTCAIYCSAGAGYDYITGLGSPTTVNF